MDHFRKEFDREMDVDTAIFCYHTYRGTKRCGTVCFFVDFLNWKTKETNSLQFQLRNWEAMKKRIGEVNTSRDL